MLNALNALSEDNSIFVVTPLTNPYLILAIMLSVFLHMMILYVPFLATIFGVAPLSLYEWGLVMAFSMPVILVDEVLKFVGRIKNEKEL
jgi:Ca2+-transporting ATPase